jgi:hypothetical protein
MRSQQSATRDAAPWGRMGELLGAAIWCVATMTLAYAVMFGTFMLVLLMTAGGGDRVQVPPAPPALALPALPRWMDSWLTFIGPLVLAGGVVLGPSRWWVGIAGGIGLGALSGTVLFLSVERHLEGTPVFALVNWVLAGYVGAIVGQCRRELRGGSASRTTGARAGAEPGAAPDRDQSHT